MRQFFTVVAALACVVALGQKPNINKAKASYDKGEITEAKTMIDLATEYEKTMDKAKTWYYRGMIYATIDTSTNDPDAMKVAIESYKKALELDPTQKTISEFTGTGLRNVDTQLQDYYGFYYNKAVAAYGAEEFADATTSFERAFYIMPSDTNSILNAGYAAVAAGEDARAKTNFVKALEAGNTDVAVYLRLYNYAIAEKDLKGAYAILDDARKVHPDNVDLMKFQINILIEEDRIDEAKAGIEEAIAKEPGNPDLHFSLGVIHEELKDTESARKSYENAIENDPEHYNSNYNLGVIAFNACNELIKERNGLSYKEEKKFAELSTQIDERLKEALPYWEKLHSLKEDETKILETLEYIYLNLKMNDEAEVVGNKLDALKTGAGG